MLQFLSGPECIHYYVGINILILLLSGSCRFRVHQLMHIVIVVNWKENLWQHQPTTVSENSKKTVAPIVQYIKP